MRGAGGAENPSGGGGLDSLRRRLLLDVPVQSRARLAVTRAAR